MRYPIAIETGDEKHAYGVVVPDLPGCFSAGDTLDEALTNARETILLRLEGLLDDGLSQIRLLSNGFATSAARGCTWAIVDVSNLASISDYRG